MLQAEVDTPKIKRVNRRPSHVAISFDGEKSTVTKSLMWFTAAQKRGAPYSVCFIHYPGGMEIVHKSEPVIAEMCDATHFPLTVLYAAHDESNLGRRALCCSKNS